MITIYYDILSPYAYMGLELFKKSSLFREQKFELIPILLAQVLKATGNPGPNGIMQKRLPVIMDACLQAKLYGIDMVGPPKHPFINLPVMRFIHCIDVKLRLEVALVLNRACWGLGLSVEKEEEIVEILRQEDFWQEDWQDLDKFTKENKGRQKLKDATAQALEVGVFGVPTFGYQNINFWGSDRLTLLKDFIKKPQYYLDNNYQQMIDRAPSL